MLTNFSDPDTNMNAPVVTWNRGVLRTWKQTHQNLKILVEMVSETPELVVSLLRSSPILICDPYHKEDPGPCSQMLHQIFIKSSLCCLGSNWLIPSFRVVRPHLLGARMVS